MHVSGTDGHVSAPQYFRLHSGATSSIFKEELIGSVPFKFFFIDLPKQSSAIFRGETCIGHSAQTTYFKIAFLKFS